MYRLRPGLELKEKIEAAVGFSEISKKIKSEILKNRFQVIAIEAYPSIQLNEFETELAQLMPESLIIHTDALYSSPEYIYTKIFQDLTEDEVFGRFSHYDFMDFICPNKIKKFYEYVENNRDKTIILLGVGASLVIPYDFLVYLDIPRWEIQQRYKNGATNWKGFREKNFNEKLKRAYYFEWPAALVIKDTILPICDFYIDMTEENQPKMISGSNFRNSIKEFTKQPFRLVPFFEPGIWGGSWLQEKFNVGKDQINLAWCFDGVPEENSIIIKNKDLEIEMPAQNIVSLYPEELLGRKVFGRYGRDFPIRFNFLDTMEGQNLSLQVHPTLDYAYRNFGVKYTQDESYYVMDCAKDAQIYLGVKHGVELKELVSEFEEAQNSGEFDDQKYINSFSVKKHDHLLIPGGTIHSSGRGNVILEISSTPNRFTFKLWDWGRLDLNGKPRPISIHHGKHVVNTAFDENFVSDELYNNIKVLSQEEGAIEEITGLHELESIKTKRLTFSKPIKQSTEKSVNMLNLVEGEHIKVHACTNEFQSFDVYYGETFIIPESVTEYTLVPVEKGKEVKVIKAYIG